MKKLIMPAFAVALLLGGQAFAADVKTDDGKGPPPGAEHRLKDADANKDGYLTKDEMLAAHQKRLDKMFERLDTDKDGKLSTAELQKGREDMRSKYKDHMKDGKPPADAPNDSNGKPE